MKTEFLYVILNIRGESWVLKDDTYIRTDLSGLLADGWRPVRETPFHNDNSILILLEREAEGNPGFGFRPS